jgi:predicted nucleic-acid-binding protein
VGRQAVKITPDTNLLVRVITEDDKKQAERAEVELADAELIALPLPTLCELVWVLSRGYGASPASIAKAIRALINDAKVILNRAAVDAGLAMLDVGGDFADGVIAYEGTWLGAECFVSFDKKAVKSLEAQGKAARLVSQSQIAS